MFSFDFYQKTADTTAIYPERGSNLAYPVLGLCGEAGEVAEKLKKAIRDDGGSITPETRKAIIKELGDVLWYVNAVCYELNVNLSVVASTNLEKVTSRQRRGTLQGSWDNR